MEAHGIGGTSIDDLQSRFFGRLLTSLIQQSNETIGATVHLILQILDPILSLKEFVSQVEDGEHVELMVGDIPRPLFELVDHHRDELTQLFQILVVLICADAQPLPCDG